jgi:hypothetical protein
MAHFRKKYCTQNVFLFSPQILTRIFSILRRTERDTIKNVNWSSCEAVAYPGILFGGSTDSVEDRGHRERGSGGGSPLVRGSAQFANE